MRLPIHPPSSATALLAALLSLGAPAITPASAALAAQEAEAAPRTVPLFTWADAAILGGFAAGTVVIAPLDRSFAERLQRSDLQENRLLGDVSTVVRNVAAPGSVIIGVGLYTVGRLTRNERAADLGLHGTEALLIGEGLAVVLKGAFGRARPYRDETNPGNFQFGRGFRGSSDYRSFPSGHTVAAFAAAAAVTSEIDRWWPNGTWAVAPLMYGGAALSGVSRMYNNRHWASDVIAGAAIGTIAGLKVVRWHHSNPDNAIDRFFLGARVTPDGHGAPAMQLLAMPGIPR